MLYRRRSIIKQKKWYMDVKIICNGCGFETGNLDTYLIYRKDAKIIETPYVDNSLLYKEHKYSYLKDIKYYNILLYYLRIN